MMCPVMTMNEITQRLYAAILEKGISYGELARLTGIPKSAIQRYATGTTGKIPQSVLTLLIVLLVVGGLIAAFYKEWKITSFDPALAAALGIPRSALTGWEESGAPAPAAETEELPEITMIARAGKKMSPERRQDMLQLLKIAFPEEFRDDDGA